MKYGESGGFTIVELLLATSIFSVVLLAALASFLQVGHLFYKGVSITTTQDVATQVVNDITTTIQSASNVSTLTTSSNGYKYYCIGNTRYTYTYNSANGWPVMANLSASAKYSSGSTATFGLLKDKLPGTSPCAAPCDPATSGSCVAGTVAFNNPVEMLGDHMRVAQLSITNSSNSLYNLSVIIAYGTDTVLNWQNLSQAPTCRGNSNTQQFCAISSLNTSVYEGLNI